MATITKAATGTALATGSSWVGGVTPGASDIARWVSTSGPTTGNMTGSLTVLGLQIDGALADRVYTSGTLTLTQTDAFVNGTSNNRRFTFSSTGVMALGASNRNLTLVHTDGGYCIDFNQAGALTGSGIVSIINGLANSNYNNAYFGTSFALAGFTGTIRFTDGTGLFSGGTATGTFTAANLLVDGPNCILSVGTSGANIGAAGRTLTVNESVTLGRSAFNMNIPSNVVLAGTGTRTLTVNGNTTMSGAVTGSDGVTAVMTGSTGRVGSSGATFLFLSGSSSGLAGACDVTGGRFIIAPSTAAARYQPSSLDIDATGQFEYYQMDSTSFTFPCTPTGTGFICINGNYSAGNGVTFSSGQLTSFGGTVRVQPVADANRPQARVRLNELPAGLDWFAHPNANLAMTGDVTYLGSASTYATNLTLDSTNNTSTAGLTAGVYSLTVPNTSGAVVITGTVQRLNTPANASARMSLTLGGSNTGDNTLSGVISEVGTNSATLGITKVDAGRWVLSGSNTHTGQTDVSGGTLSAQSANALGGTSGTVIIRSGATLELNGGYTFDKRDADWEARSASGGIDSIGANTILCRNFALTESLTTFTVSTGNKLTIDPQLSGAVEGAITGVNLGIAKAGAGELELAANANTFSGAVTISAGTLTVGSVANGGVAAAWGQASSAVAVSGTLKYSGATGSSSRAVQMTGSAPTINASGSGALTLSNVTQDTTAKTMTLRGTSTAANTVSNAIANNTGTVSLAKEDAGKWVLSGALSYTGTTAVNGGTLRVETGNSNTTSGAVTIGASGTVELVTDTLASAGGTSGEVLGTGNVTVSGGTIKTRGGTTQKGQVRYGGNLTFGAGSTLYIGAAA